MWFVVWFIVLILLSTPLVEAQGISPASRRDRNARLSPEVKHAARSITGREALEHVRWLADDLRDGRLAGTVGGHDSGEYIADRLEEFGILPGGDDGSWFHNFSIPGRDGIHGPVDRGNRLRLLVSDRATREETLQFQSEFLPHPRSPDAVIENSCAFMLEPMQFIEEKERDPIEGKVVVLPVEEPLSDEILEATCEEIARRKGIALLLVGEACRPEPSEVWPPADAQELLPIPVARVHGTGVKKIWKISGRPLQSWKRQSRDDGSLMMNRPFVSLEIRRDGRDHSLGRNVVGRVLGVDPELRDEFIVIGAHYDHVGRGLGSGLSRGDGGEIHNGADDNASGVSALLEVAEAYSLNRLRTRRSILFVAFDAEELGLHGSTAFVSDGGYSPAKIAGMVNMDMISRNDLRTVKVGRRAKDEQLGKIIYDMARVLELEIDETGMDAVLNRSDQAPFLREDIPSVFYFGGFHDDYHKPEDDIDRVNPAKIQNVGRLAFLTSWGLSQMNRAAKESSETDGTDQ